MISTPQLVCTTIACIILFARSVLGQETRHFSVPFDLKEDKVYLSASNFGEAVVVYSGKGSDLRPNDYITHADNSRILSGGLKEFLANGEREAVIPIVDDEDIQYGGGRLLGFAKLVMVTPMQLSARRGEVSFDLTEGGLIPIGISPDSISGYKPPSHGGGKCITARDCFNFNGTCVHGQCLCRGDQTGTFCQLYRPGTIKGPTAAAAHIEDTLSALGGGGSFVAASVASESGVGHTTGAAAGGKRRRVKVKPGAAARKKKPAPGGASSNSDDSNQKQQQQQQQESKVREEEEQRQKQQRQQRERTLREQQEQKQREQQEQQRRELEQRQQKDREQQQRTQQSQSQSPAGSLSQTEAETALQKQQQTEQPANPNNENGGTSIQRANEDRAQAMGELYGPNKAYPLPYPAGKVPIEAVHTRHRSRVEKKTFVYAVRFRNGPFGIAFDNKLEDATVVERVNAGMQAEQSDIKVGDKLIAVDQFNTSEVSAKATQRLMSALSWPRVLVFEAPGGKEEGGGASAAEPAAAGMVLHRHLVNVTILYPPTIAGSLQMRVAQWTPGIDMQGEHGNACPLYLLNTANDLLGCEVQDKEYDLPIEDVEAITSLNGFVDSEVEERYPMLSMIFQEAFTRRVKLETRSMAVMKRGVCTFVAKAKGLAKGVGDVGLLVNSDNTLMEMPAGKEPTAECTQSLGLVREEDGGLILQAAIYGGSEVIAMITDPDLKDSVAFDGSPCGQTLTIAKYILDRWAHSTPHVKPAQVLQLQPPSQRRGMTEEGGRISVSGENGWAYFDYHLAMFGPQELPAGPYRLQMAFPPFGCDPSAYTVRITGTVVAILRGGGCSFGIKVINAQKLGARAVIIVNTDDVKTMRLMALPDETPQIKIPCIMVSRRLQYYLEEQLRRYYLLDQHFVSFDATGVFGDYEMRNSLQLPVRL